MVLTFQSKTYSAHLGYQTIKLKQQRYSLITYLETHVLVSYGLIPNELLLPITNTTIPPQGSFVYLGTLNIVNGVITTTTGSFNTSEISSLLDQNNLVYSNGNSEIWYVACPLIHRRNSKANYFES